MESERRFIPASGIEIRTGVGGEPRGIAGLGAAYDKGAIIAGRFEERIAPGAFDDALREADVVGLFNHDSNFVLGRTTSGTMKLEARGDGLYYDIPDLPKSRADVLEAIRRGDVEGNSFSFTIESDEDEEWTDRSDEGQLPLRVIKRIGRLYDVGPVTFPAYAGHTHVSARSLEKVNEIAGEELPPCLRCRELEGRLEAANAIIRRMGV